MNHIFKIALLDDNPKQLEKLIHYLQPFNQVEVVLVSSNVDDFFEKQKNVRLDILITDLDLGNENMTGFEIAQELKIPTFFASINTSDYIEDIEELKREIEFGVDHITKPFKENQFSKSFNRFLKEVELFSNLEFTYLDFGKTKRNKILINDIVYLCADKNAGSESNNKLIYFINRKSENLIDFSFSKMEEKRLMKSQFITVHKSFRVNKNYIKCYHKKSAEIEVDVFDEKGKTKCHKLQVSENYQNDIKKIFV